jgi:branched-chain amino acid transport system substrate-binding protein
MLLEICSRPSGVVLPLIVVVMLLASAFQPAFSAEPILIGVSAPLTGDNASNGQESLNGAKLAAKQINAKGGILGRPIQIVEGDDRCDPKEGAIVAQKFVAQKIVAAASHYCSGAALAALPIFKESNILYVDWGAVSSKIAAYGYDKFFATIYNGAYPGIVAGNVAGTRLSKRKLSVVDDRSPATSEFAGAFQKRAKEVGAEVVMADHVTQGEKDFNAFVTKLKGSGAELLFLALYYPEAGLLTRQIRNQEVNVTLVCIDTCLDPQYLKIAGTAAAEGVYSVTQPQATELPAAREFVEEYKKDFGKEPGYIAPYPYDAMNVIAQAYTATGKVDNEAAAKWLKSLKKENALKGITGPLYWSPDGTLPEFFFSLYQVKGGKFQFVAPAR